MSKTITVCLAVALVSFGMVSDACQTATVLLGGIVAAGNPAELSPAINGVEEPQSPNATAAPEINNLPAIHQTVDPAETPEVGNAVVDQAATPRTKNAATTPQIIDAAVTPQTTIAAAIPPTANPGVTPQIKNAAAVLPTTLASNWQYWEYCLAPSYAEHKIYFSKPIPINSIIGKVDDLFESQLNKAGLAHDVVQCPIAPNKPTLLFRQKYAVRFNEEDGMTIVDLDWD